MQNMPWIWCWVGGGYHYVKATSRDEAIEAARRIASIARLAIDEATLHQGTNEELDMLAATTRHVLAADFEKTAELLNNERENMKGTIYLEQGKFDPKKYTVKKLRNRVVPECGHILTRDEVLKLQQGQPDLTIEISESKKKGR